MHIRSPLKVLLSLIALKSFLLLTACGSLQTASYKGPGDFQTPDNFGTGGGRSTYQTGDFQLVWPVDHVRINQQFQEPKNPKHKGIDLGGPRGTPIRAAHQGVVVYAGRRFKGYGKMVLVEYNQQWATLYAHLDKINVDEGDKVSTGDLIGKMGRTGRATGVHLHFEVIKDKVPVDPLRFLRQPENIVAK